MAIKAVNAISIATQLGRMFKGVAFRLFLDETLKINFDALSLMVQMKHSKKTGNYSAAIYSLTDANKHTVPQGERWFLIELMVDVMTVNSKGCVVCVGGVQYAIYAAFSGANYTNVDLSGWVLDAGDWVCVNNSGDGGDTARETCVAYQRLPLDN